MNAVPVRPSRRLQEVPHFQTTTRANSSPGAGKRWCHTDSFSLLKMTRPVEPFGPGCFSFVGSRNLCMHAGPVQLLAAPRGLPRGRQPFQRQHRGLVLCRVLSAKVLARGAPECSNILGGHNKVYKQTTAQNAGCLDRNNLGRAKNAREWGAGTG